jgi:hypothetical protein
MGKIFKVTSIFLILTSIIWLAAKQEHLKKLIFKTDVDHSPTHITKIHDQEQPPEDTLPKNTSLEADYEDYYSEINSDINQQNQITNTKTESNDLNCKLIFISLNNIFIKFFQNQDFTVDAHLLQNVTTLPLDLHNKIDKIKNLYNNKKQSNIIQNKIAAKMIYIEKISDNLSHKKQFLGDMNKLQEYFYSPKFISNCKS